jgi:peroxiredoxin
VIILAYILVNSLQTKDNEVPQASSKLAAFAAPAVLSDLDGDANLATPGHTGDEAGNVPACELRGPDIVNSCELSEDAPLVLGFYFTRGAECEGAFDRMQELQADHPGVNFAGVVVRGDRDDARKIVREQGWTFPIAFDRDGAIANVFGVPGCPQAVLVYPGGTVRETVIGRDRAERELPERVAALVAESRKQGWRP